MADDKPNPTENPPPAEKPASKPKAPAKRDFVVADGCAIYTADGKYTGGMVVSLTAAEFKQYPKGQLLPYVPDDEEGA